MYCRCTVTILLIIRFTDYKNVGKIIMVYTLKKNLVNIFQKYRHEVSILYGMICFGDANLQFVDFDNENHCSYRLHIVVTLYGMR